MLHKLTADKKKLSATLAAASTAARGSDAAAGFHLSFNGTRLIARCANQNESVSARCDDVTGSGEFEIVTPLRLADVLSVMPGDTVDFEVDDNEVLIKSGTAEVGLLLSPVNSFPTPRPVPETTISIASSDLVAVLDTVKFAASESADRAIMRAIKFGFGNGKVTFQATDSYRLSMNSIEWSDAVDNVDVLVPKTAVALVTKLLTGDTIKIGVDPKGNYVYFTDGKVSVVATVIAGEYPKVEGIIPVAFNVKIEVTSDDLAEALRFVQVTGEKDSAIVMECDSDGIVVSASDSSAVTSRKATMPLDGRVVEGGEITFGVNPTYLMQAVDAVGGGLVTIALVDAMKALRVVGPDENNVQIVMPKRV